MARGGRSPDVGAGRRAHHRFSLIAEQPEFGTLDRKQIAALFGLAPFTRQSGARKGKSFIASGRASMRTGLYMAALVASRRNKEMRTFYARLLAAGKPKMVAFIAVACKLITILNAIMRDRKNGSPSLDSQDSRSWLETPASPALTTRVLGSLLV